MSLPVVYGQDVSGSVVPYNVTGWTARMQFRSSIASPTVLDEFTTENGRIVVNGAAGQFTLKASATQTSAWSFTSAVYDLEIVDTSGNVIRLLKGNVVVDPEVTR